MNAHAEYLVALDRQLTPRSSFDQALLDFLALRPRSGADGMRDGRRAAMVAALDNRATWIQIREWRRGNVPAPKWATELLASKMLERRAVLDRGIFAALKNKTAGD